MDFGSIVNNIPQANIPEVGKNVSTETKAEMRKSAEEFESFFLFQVLELMSPKPSEKSLFDNSFATEMYNKQLNEQTAKSVAKSGGIGIADRVYNEMIKQQEAL